MSVVSWQQLHHISKCCWYHHVIKSSLQFFVNIIFIFNTSILMNKRRASALRCAELCDRVLYRAHARRGRESTNFCVLAFWLKENAESETMRSKTRKEHTMTTIQHLVFIIFLQQQLKLIVKKYYTNYIYHHHWNRESFCVNPFCIIFTLFFRGKIYNLMQ